MGLEWEECPFPTTVMEKAVGRFHSDYSSVSSLTESPGDLSGILTFTLRTWWGSWR